MLRNITLLAAITMLAACVPETKVPVDTLFYQNGVGAETDCLVVLMPGRGDRMADFAHEGFIAAARQAGLRADIVATDLHIGYIINRSVMRRLQDDVVMPYRQKGYQRIWLVGISMGAMGAIFHERDYPGYVSGIVFMAPFLGDDDILDEVEEAGGVLGWEPTAPAGENYGQDLWAWIRKYAEKEASPQVYLAYGIGDRFSRASRLMAAVLPPEHIIAVDGGHRWSTWLRLWQEVLDRRILCNGN
jgi:pimeloyl-ACP methyl ester carboxylesterase